MVKRLRMDHPEEMPLKGGIVALCPHHGHLPYFRRLTILYVQSANVPIQRSTAYRPLILLAISCALEWWDVRTPVAILNVFDFLDYTYFKISISLILKFSRLLVSFASLAESCEISIEHPSMGLASLAQLYTLSMNKSQELMVFYGRQKLTSAKN